jgi:hypothetical protein
MRQSSRCEKLKRWGWSYEKSSGAKRRFLSITYQASENPTGSLILMIVIGRRRASEEKKMEKLESVELD